MENPLAISGIGMVILFLALALLYGLMYALTGLTRKRPQAEAKEQENRKPEVGSAASLPSAVEGAALLPSTVGGAASLPSTPRDALRRRAAAIGVALARAERELPRAGAAAAEEGTDRWRISPWRALHHQRRLTCHQNGPSKRVMARNRPPRSVR